MHRSSLGSPSSQDTRNGRGVRRQCWGIIGHILLFIFLINNLIICLWIHDYWWYHIQASGEDYSVEPADSRRPFRALLDVGLVKTTTGNRVFGALKVFDITSKIKNYCFHVLIFLHWLYWVIWLDLLQGALDGGLDIPHSDKRFAGFDKEKKELDAEVHRKYIFGGHVTAYMKARSDSLFCGFWCEFSGKYSYDF